MTLAPRFLVSLWLRFRLACFKRQLKSLGRGIAIQQTTFAQRMARIETTAFGREHRINATTTYAQFQTQVPLRQYAAFVPLIKRMQAGEPAILTPDECQLYVETDGTTGPEPKRLPTPESMWRHYRQGLRASLFLYALRTGRHSVFLGRSIHTGSSTALHQTDAYFHTSLDGALNQCLSPWVAANLKGSPDSVSLLAPGPEKDAALAASMAGQNVTLLAGTPANINRLANAVREILTSNQPAPPHLQAYWTNLECLLFTGAPLSLYGDGLRRKLGPSVHFHEIYLAAEGIIAAQDNDRPNELRLLTDLGIFFEFLPLSQYQPETLASAGALCLPLEHVACAVDYVLLLTTPAGLCRYVLGDVVRFVSVDPPRLRFVSRLHSQLNGCGEQISERELLESVVAVCQQNEWQPVNFHVAPYVHRAAAGQILTCHEWWLELRPGTIKTPTANVLAPALDSELSQRNPHYAAKRTAHILGAPSVRLVMPGTFAQWAQQQRATDTSKIPGCRSDRQIADQLAVLAGFHQATEPKFIATKPPSPT